MGEREQPVACTLGEADQGRRKAELENGLADLIREARRLPDGYALRFAADPAARRAVDEFVAFERQCCSFMTYSVKEEGGSVWLTMNGPEGTAEFVESWLPRTAAAPRGGAGPPFVRLGLIGTATALAAFVCCGTPILGAALAAVGLGAWSAAVAAGVDIGASALLIASLCALAAAWWRRARTSPSCEEC